MYIQYGMNVSLGKFEEDVMTDLTSKEPKINLCQKQDLKIMCLLFHMKDCDRFYTMFSWKTL